MSQNEIIKITNANNNFDAINKLNLNFLEKLSNPSLSENIPSSINIDEQKILISCFGYNAIASSRIVKDEVGTFAVEYVFYIILHEEKIEVWRFYLLSNGRIIERLDSEVTFCDYDNVKVADNLCLRLLTVVFDSPLFTPLQY